MHDLIWRVPLRNQSRGDGTAHLMPSQRQTNKLFRTYCSLDVNPGFSAEPTKKTPQCSTCKAWSESIKFPHYGKPQDAPTA